VLFAALVITWFVWFAASAAPLLMALGCALSGILLERCGRRLAQLLICAPFAAGWVLLAAAPGLGTILAGRFLTGLCVGLVGKEHTLRLQLESPHLFKCRSVVKNSGKTSVLKTKHRCFRDFSPVLGENKMGSSTIIFQDRPMFSRIYGKLSPRPFE